MDTDGRRREIGRDLGRAARCRVAAAWKSCALRRAKPMTDSGTPQARLPMNKNLLIGLLAFTTLACGVLAVWSSQQRATLEVRVEQQAAVQPQAAAAQAKEAATAAAAEAELATLREQLAKSEATVRDLRGEVSLLRAGRGFGPSLSGRPGALPVPRAMLSEMLGKPETVGLAMDWIKADQYSRYAALIARQTQLTDAQREELRTVLAERYATRMDFSSAEADGALPEGQRREADVEFHQKLAALVGDSEAELFERVETKPVSAERLQQLDDRLRYESVPLDRDQYAALWPVLSSGVFYMKRPQTQADADALLQQRTEANAKVLAGAESLLQPAQYKTLERLLRDDTVKFQIQMQTTIRLRAAMEAAKARAKAAGKSAPAPR